MFCHGLPLVGPQDTLFHGLGVLDEKGLEIALVVDGGKLIGMLTDGDCRRAFLAGKGFECPVKDAMQPNFTWAPPEMGRAEVLDLMKARRLKQVPVLGPGNELLGLHILNDLLGTYPRENAALILCGGLGTRLRPITESIPKPMIEVAGRPILERLVLHLVGQGFRHIYLATHYLGEMIEAHFGDGHRFGCEITYLRERTPMGTGGSLGMLPDELTLPILIMNGDLVTNFDAGNMVDKHQENGDLVTVGYSTHIHEVPFGVLELEGGHVMGWREKPQLSFPISAGIYVISPIIAKRVRAKGATPITWVVEDCLVRGEAVGTFPVDDGWVDIGRHEELRQARGGV